MAIAEKHAVYAIKAYLNIDGKSVPIISARIEFSVNQLPTAQVTVPSGFKLSASPKAEDLFTSEQLKGKPKAQILISGKGKPHPAPITGPSRSRATPSGDINDLVLFDGYLGAKSIQFGTSGVSTIITLFHWASDLDTCSFAHGSFAKNAPQSWFVREDNSEKNARQPFLDAGCKPHPNPDIWTTADWWESILKPGLLCVANKPSLLYFPKQPAANTDIVAAVEKIKSYGKLKLKTALRGNSIKENIDAMAAGIIFGPNGGSSAYEKIISFLSQFNLVFAPRVDECLIMAYNPVGPIDVTLNTDEYDFGSNSGNPAVLPRGAILYGTSDPAFKVTNAKEYVTSSFVGSYESPATKYTDGPFITFNRPAWFPSTGIETTTGGGPVSIVGTGGTPTAPPTTPNSKPNLDLGNALARSSYFNSLFAARAQEIICGFRLDIAPGDCLALEVDSSGQNVSGGSGGNKRGVVETVTYILDGGNTPKINTIYRLRHVFDSSDIDIFKLGSGLEHPLFSDKPLNTISPLKRV